LRDGSIYTSAGITAGIDLSLALVEEDHGHETALKIARFLVMFLVRPGGQAQYSHTLSHQAITSELLRELQVWMLQHLRKDLSVESLAERIGPPFHAYLPPRDWNEPRPGEHGIKTCSAGSVLVNPATHLSARANSGNLRTNAATFTIHLSDINKIRPEFFFQPRNHFNFEIEERLCPNKLQNTITKPPNIMIMPPAIIARPQDTMSRITTNRPRITLIPPKAIFITPHITRLKQQNLTPSITATRLKPQESNGLSGLR
jgi:hypothetical protein